MSLGVVENPVTGKKHTNMDQARMLVLDLEMLLAKTAGNLTEIETNQLEKVSSDLRHLYDQKSPDCFQGRPEHAPGSTARVR